MRRSAWLETSNLFSSFSARTAAFIALLAFSSLALSQANSDRTEFMVEGSGTVSFVADGDTMRVEVDSPESWSSLKQHAIQAQKDRQRDLRVDDRFWTNPKSFLTRIGSIDTAESVSLDPKKKNTAAGKMASNYAKKLMNGKRVSFACWEIGYYGRPVCSIWTPDFEFGTHMIKQGHTDYKTKYGRHPFWHSKYKAAQNH